MERRLPELQWSSVTHTPADFPNHFTKPQIVRLLPSDSTGEEADLLANKINLGPDLETSEPFLIYSHRRRTKVFAEHVVLDKSKKNYVPDGVLLEMPKDYIGWLEVVGKDGKSKGHYKTVQDVVSTGCKYFLTRTTLLGFKVEEDEENGLQILEEQKIYPGEVVKVENICAKKWKLVDGTLRGLVKPETQFLKCVDLKKNILCVSLAHPGIFNPVAQKGNERDDMVVYVINDIFKVFKLPIYVRLTFGWPPKLRKQNFSGVMKLIQMDKRESLIAYNFIGEGSVIAELPTDLDIRIQTVENMTDYESNLRYKKALDHCMSLVYPYVIGIKSMEIPYAAVGQSLIKKKPLAYGRMARPVDMTQFSRSDIYPPLEEQQMSTLSRISFKDPERALKGLYNMNIDAIQETSTDGTIISHSRTSSGGSSQVDRLSDKLGQQDIEDQSENGRFRANNPRTLTREMTDARAKRINELIKREAPC